MEYLEGETLAGGLEQGASAPDRAVIDDCDLRRAEMADRAGISHRDLEARQPPVDPDCRQADRLRSGDTEPEEAVRAPKFTWLWPPRRESDTRRKGHSRGRSSTCRPTKCREGNRMPAVTSSRSARSSTRSITGKRAFEGKSQLSVAAAIVEDDPAPIASVRSRSAPADLDRAIVCCLAKNPEKGDVGKLLVTLRSN